MLNIEALREYEMKVAMGLAPILAGEGGFVRQASRMASSATTVGGGTASGSRSGTASPMSADLFGRSTTADVAWGEEPADLYAAFEGDDGSEEYFREKLELMQLMWQDPDTWVPPPPGLDAPSFAYGMEETKLGGARFDYAPPSLSICHALDEAIPSTKRNCAPGTLSGTNHGKSTNKAWALSVGSVGHPENCKQACPYVKRKGGCRDGVKCKKCHECFWQRPAANPTPLKKPNTLEMGFVSPPEIPPPPAPFTAGVDGSEEVPSVGSLGHPGSCAKACKYFSKGKGCKDGRWCVRCHICIWRRCNE
mmetsp:Transcript_96241/g.269273  ORF Transcript_96241/g.269273 Transcript_96241/m.269273 type:complete len:307 (-) Transcript_96241:151-1071(-)